MEKMRAILITLFLFVGATIAKDVDNGKAIDPARDAEKGETINELNKSKSQSVSVLDKTEPQAHDGVTNPTREREAHIGETINPVLKKSQPEAYDESSKLKKLVTYCNSNVANACSSGTKPLHEEGGINHQHELGLCLFDFMERCLLDHGASLYKATPTDHQGLQFFDSSSWDEAEKTPENNFPYLPDILLPKRKPPTFPTSTSKDNNQQGLQFFDSSKKEPIVTYANDYPMLRGYQQTVYSSKDNYQGPQFFDTLTFPTSTFKYEPPRNTRSETPKSIPIETIKFRTVLRTCTQVSAQSCYTTSAVETPHLAACLIPSMNQCMNSYAATLGDPPFMP